MKLSTKHDDWLFLQLKDADFAAEFLNAASQDDDPKTYLVALRKVVEARGGMAYIAEKAELSRETLYRTLSIRGNPTIKTLSAVLKATGLKFGVTTSVQGLWKYSRPRHSFRTRYIAKGRGFASETRLIFLRCFQIQ